MYNIQTEIKDRDRTRRRKFFQPKRWSSFLAIFLVLGCASLSFADYQQPTDYLSEESVILITGAVGFLGSELALALYRTYSPKKIICVDRMGDHPQSQEELSLFEFQRQRAFHVLQTLGPKGRFYRVDFRPMIPEYFDLGEVPVLDHIFREHSDITHIVHLADPFPPVAAQAVPREKDVPKAGMMEALLEQMLKVKREGKRVPHFTYASSSEVYPYASNSTSSPLTEEQPISTPSSIRGASKLIDEILAKMYDDMHGVYSVGLRFFQVYGPWSVPGSPLFEMAERAVTGDKSLWDSQWLSIKDYVYIDDAIDCVMAAMQFRPLGERPPPFVVNVASGTGSSLQDIANVMEEYFPRKYKTPEHEYGEEVDAAVTVSFGSTERAEKLLGYKPQVALRDGIVQLLAWHYDRAFPYGGHQDMTNERSKFIANKGIVSCLPHDKECLRAAPVFPCASECSHAAQCTGSFYDEVVGWTQALTASCETVLYTVDLDPSLVSLPSAHIRVKTTSKSFVNGNCNLAFVSERSHLVQSLSRANPVSSLMGAKKDKLLREGKWILVPLNVPNSALEGDGILKLLPKLSPGLFFGSSTKMAIYCDPDIVLDSIPKLLREVSVQPYSDEVQGATAMLIGKGKPKSYFAQTEEDTPKKQVLESTKTVVQNAAYRMVRIAVSDELFGDGFMELLDSRWMVYKLNSDDSRLFRCDVFGEVVQWDVDTDRSALEFVLGLHDMWSRVIVKESGTDPWWIGDNVVTVPEGVARRRLEEEETNETRDEEGVEGDKEVEENSENDDGNEGANYMSEKGVANVVEDGLGGFGMDGSEGDNDISEKGEGDADAVAVEDGHGGFVIQAEDAQPEVEAGDEKRGASSEQDDDEEESTEDKGAESDVLERDFSSYDTWMGILSASPVKYFVRIVESSEVGVVSLEDYDRDKEL